MSQVSIESARPTTIGARAARAVALAAALALGAASAARAAIFIDFSPYQVALNAGETLVTNFDSPILPSGFASSGTAAVMSGFSLLGAAPATSLTTYDTSNYLSVGIGQSYRLDTTALHEISLYVGSLDTYNSFTFTGAGGTQTFTGADLAAAAAAQANGNQSSSATNGRYSFTFDDPITSVTLASTSPALEVSNIGAIPVNLAVVPEPGPWLLMILGLGGIGFMLRTRRRLVLA
jgi:hypothetical protein